MLTKPQTPKVLLCTQPWITYNLTALKVQLWEVETVDLLSLGSLFSLFTDHVIFFRELFFYPSTNYSFSTILKISKQEFSRVLSHGLKRSSKSQKLKRSLRRVVWVGVKIICWRELRQISTTLELSWNL